MRRWQRLELRSCLQVGSSCQLLLKVGSSCQLLQVRRQLRQTVQLSRWG